jgi:hypothetical protein
VSVLDRVVADDHGVSWVSGGAPRDAYTLWRWDSSTGKKRAVGETSCCFSIVADGTEIFYVHATQDETKILAAPLAGGAPRVVTSFQGGGQQLTLVAVDADSVYYASSPGNNLLIAVPRAGGAPARTILGLTRPLDGSTFDGTHLYWMEQEGSMRRIERVHLATGKKETIAADPTLTSAIAIDRCNVYYAVGTTVVARGK